MTVDTNIQCKKTSSLTIFNNTFHRKGCCMVSGTEPSTDGLCAKGNAGDGS
jgi:hypothetical protein